ncbi:hypothetical protein CAPTEDRAFT_156960 [Capitella teleta]|uniref:Amine oxidase domain-containing protein n=1 Tax=Capitella teleta TaxID=283909 RepID=R7U7D1_CAPTE|nr:hypothetical protein CAPTEDRAFT_156960 [Capitella teleta]|eukprot:ELT99581.1 hypothetical protein CAPTEDRAFT_156960 [Capitella teleta]
MLERVLIVGSGITAAVTASLLRNILPSTCSLSIWDKARGPGGRMATNRCPNNDRCTVDLGVQYISPISSELHDHKSIYNDLLQNGFLSPMRGSIEGENPYDDDATHYVTPKGSGSIVKHFLEAAGAAIRYNHHVDSITLCDNKTWDVCTLGGQKEQFDCVLLTMPAPQILQLKGSIPSLLESQQVAQRLEAVSYSARFALGLFFSPVVTINVPWSVKYVERDPVIRYIAIDNKKRDSDQDVSMVVHTTVPFGLENIERDKDTICQEVVLPRLRELMPDLPTPVSVKNHKWRFSQVHHAYEGKPGAVVLNEAPLLVIGGDSFTYSKLDGCVYSAEKMVKIISAKL